MKNLMVAGVFALLAIANVANGMDVICYVTSWSVYKPEPVKYEMSDVDPNLCDIVIYSFYKIENNVISQIESFDNQNLQRLAGLKAMNPNFKVLVAVGGATASHAFPGMVASAHTRKQFIDSCLSLMRTYQVDGIDLDWEYPGWNDKQNFVALVREMRQAFGSQYMITGAFPAGTSTIDGGYDIAALTPNLDYIGVMSYDYNGCWGGNALEHNAPLYAPSGSTIPSLNIDTTMKHYLAKGATADKLVLGLAFYARGMGLSASTANIGDRLGNGYCPQGTYTQTGGFLAYYEICSYKSQGLERRWNEAGKVPFVTGNNRWWGYDDSQSLSEKINYAKAHGFRGVMIWTIDYDDFNNAICSEGRYPMLSHVHTEAKSGGTGPIPTKPPVPPPTTTTTTSKPGGGGGSHTVCSCGKQFEPDYQTGCQNYYVCSNGQASYSQACPPGTLFSYNSQACDWPYNVNCQVPCNT